jgi:superfamily II DNA or RNA helicase
MSRRDVINEAFELVLSRMALRPPQAQALDKLRDLLIRLPRPLGECSDQEVRQFMTFGDFSHALHPSFIISLATGVGKTRLAGAIMALLWLSGEAQNFLFLAPNRTVLNRLRNSFNPSFREYIFIEENLVPEPILIVSDQLEDPVATGRQQGMFSNGPTIYLLTHQLIATSPRFRQSSNEFSGEAPADYLHSLPDLVVISDEAHHIDESEDLEAAWPRSIAELNPRLHLGLTATPPRDAQGQLRTWVNLLYQYTLQEALRQELYTKHVDMLVKHFSEEVDATELDRATIRYAIQRLEAKSQAIRSSSGPSPFPDVKPILLFFAQDTVHATGIAEQLREEFGIPDSEILLTHSRKSKTVEAADLLSGIEAPENPIRFVVNVQELVEGWDVTNVYVIAPLRAMASFAFGVQAMGRGLRLPAGERTGHSQVDTLDVICFGRDTLERIIEQETAWAGRSPSGQPLIGTKQWNSPQTTPVTIKATLVRSEDLEICDLELLTQEIDVKLGAAAFNSIRKMIVSKLRVAAAQVSIAKAEGRMAYSRTFFVDAVASEVIRRMPRYLSDDLHGAVVKAEVERWLRETTPEGNVVEYNPTEVAGAMVTALNYSAERELGTYSYTGQNSNVRFAAFPITFDIATPEDGAPPPPPQLEDIPYLGERESFIRRSPYRGWARGLHSIYTFDSWHEAKAAKLIDRSDVAWWVRNQPRKFQVETPAGMFSPDMIVAKRWSPDVKEILLLEIKGDVFWSPPDGKARLKASAARRWVEQQNEYSATRWSFEVALESAIDSSSTWEELNAKFLIE